MKLNVAALGAVALASTAVPASADQISATLFNNTVYTQTSNSAPSTPSGYFFNVGANVLSGSYDTATATYSGPGSPLNIPAAGSNFAYGSPFYGSLSALHADFPITPYTVTVTGSSTTQSATINYTQDLFSSDIPYLLDFSSLNGIDPSKSHTVHFNAFTPAAGTSGITFFSIFGAFDAGFLPPSATDATISANALLPNTTYTFELDFSDRLGGTDGGNFTEQGFDVRTDGTFTTGNIAPVPEPSTWAMLLLGFVGLGSAGYRRAHRHSITA